MVKINRIYTRTGDKGETCLIGGTRVSKNSLRVQAYGDIDELNSHLGYCRTLAEQENFSLEQQKFALVQNELFDLGALLACPADVKHPGIRAISESQIKRIESEIDQAVSILPELTSFVLPGGTLLNASLHIARSVCRRAERSVLTLRAQEEIPENIIPYLNRLSDWLFALARLASVRNNVAEYLWNTSRAQPTINTASKIPKKKRKN